MRTGYLLERDFDGTALAIKRYALPTFRPVTIGDRLLHRNRNDAPVIELYNNYVAIMQANGLTPRGYAEWENYHKEVLKKTSRLTCGKENRARPTVEITTRRVQANSVVGATGCA